MKSIGFAVEHAPNHVTAFYGRLISFLAQELGSEFSLIRRSEYPKSVMQLDGKYRIVIFATRGTAARFSKHATRSKAFLIDHGVVHSNRNPSLGADFELFSSGYLRTYYSGVGLEAGIQSWCSRYFLTEDTPRDPLGEKECIIYFSHKQGVGANSKHLSPFSIGDNINLVKDLSPRFDRVWVVWHLNADDRLYHALLSEFPSNVSVLSHGERFIGRICRVDSVIFDYSSVFATALWNPHVKLFQRVPEHPAGPSRKSAHLFHEMMEDSSYRVIGNTIVPALEQAEVDDSKSHARSGIHRKLYCGETVDAYQAVLMNLVKAHAIAKEMSL